MKRESKEEKLLSSCNATCTSTLRKVLNHRVASGNCQSVRLVCLCLRRWPLGLALARLCEHTAARGVPTYAGAGGVGKVRARRKLLALSSLVFNYGPFLSIPTDKKASSPQVPARCMAAQSDAACSASTKPEHAEAPPKQRCPTHELRSLMC